MKRNPFSLLVRLRMPNSDGGWYVFPNDPTIGTFCVVTNRRGIWRVLDGNDEIIRNGFSIRKEAIAYGLTTLKRNGSVPFVPTTIVPDTACTAIEHVTMAMSKLKVVENFLCNKPVINIWSALCTAQSELNKALAKLSKIHPKPRRQLSKTATP